MLGYLIVDILKSTIHSPRCCCYFCLPTNMKSLDSHFKLHSQSLVIVKSTSMAKAHPHSPPTTPLFLSATSLSPASVVSSWFPIGSMRGNLRRSKAAHIYKMSNENIFFEASYTQKPPPPLSLALHPLLAWASGSIFDSKFFFGCSNNLAWRGKKSN